MLVAFGDGHAESKLSRLGFMSPLEFSANYLAGDITFSGSPYRKTWETSPVVFFKTTYG
jgi:hypothetical protein